MIEQNISKMLSNISLTLFRKNFFGIYHGAISLKVGHESFIINKRNAIFDEIDEDSLCELTLGKPDYRWNISSVDSHIHSSIYTHIHEAKYIAFGMPPYTSAYSLEHDHIEFEDYFGQTLLGNIAVYDPGDFTTWYDRNAIEIVKYFKQNDTNIIIIKGVGVYIFERNINNLIKKAAVLENSCRLLSIKSSF
ncbi:MAG: class II aldolase and adducin N-terminal domain-containing protein [Campylobacterota bacterium]|nr:class II aldolase and adducin N-terminal domain-containing protein [Campylobacterota bacterium]